MAEDIEAGKEAEAAASVQDAAGEGEAPAEGARTAPAPAPAPAAPSRPWRGWGTGLLLIGLLAVLLSASGVFALARVHPSPIQLGLGLLLWGALDLIGQARGLVSWKGPKAAAGKVVNLLRGLALLGLGVWLLLSGLGLRAPLNPAVILWGLVCLVFLYLGAVLVLEMLVSGLRVGGQAWLLASLVLIFFSYFYFSMPFTFSWAAVLAALAFGCGIQALRRGALEESRSLTVAVLLVLLGLSLPLLTYTFQQAYGVQEQPLFTPTLLVPRMTEVLGGLGPAPGQLRWAPVHTQPGQPGDVLFSDKVALVDHSKGGAVLKLFQQHGNHLREVFRLAVPDDVSLTAFSQDGRRLCFTEALAITPAAGASSARAASATASAASARAVTPTAGWEQPQRLGVLEPSTLAPLSLTLTAAPAPLLPPFSLRHPQPWLLALWRAVWSLRRAAPEPPQRLDGLDYALRAVASGTAHEPAHGQVWLAPLGHRLYYAQPAGGPRDLTSSVWSYDLRDGSRRLILAHRAYPAASHDGKALLSVGFTPRQRYFAIADEEQGEYGDLVPVHERRFDAAREERYFPAWNADQTEVLHMDESGQGLMIMDANGHHRRPFDPRDLDSERWKTSDGTPFLLRWDNIGDTYSVYRSRPDGSDDTLIYSTESRDISPPQWSADDRRVAFIVLGRDGLSRVFTVGADGSWPRFFFATKDSLDELRWSPDSLRLAWICRRGDGTSEIWTADWKGLEPTRVHVDTGSISGLSWSPLGKHLAVQQVRAWTFLGLRLIRPDLRTVLMVNLMDDQARVMTRYGIMSWDPAFSPHGEAIAYFTDDHPWSWRALRERTSSLVVSQLY